MIATYIDDALDHVLDVAAYRADGGELLTDSHPLLNEHLLLAQHLHVYRHVTEVATERAARTLDGHASRLHRHAHCNKGGLLKTVGNVAPQKQF